MFALHHPLDDVGEQVEVVLLGGDQWVLFKERNNRFDEIRPAFHGETCQIMPMIVVSAVLDDRSAPEELKDELKCGSRWCKLRDRELVLDLPTEPTASISHHRYRETAFAVGEPDDPLSIPGLSC